MFLAELRRHPWAILPDYVPVISRVLARLERGEPMAASDRASVDAGQERWAARRHNSGTVMPTATVGLIPIHGILTQRGGVQDLSTPTTSTSQIAALVRQAVADPSIATIILDIDSPGGSVYGIQELADAIFEARRSKPVISVANSLAASAAYWVGSQASEFYAAPGAELGSIGVYTIHADYSEALKQEGIAMTYISAGKYKVEGNPYGPLTPEARAAVQSSIDGYYQAFTSCVARGRGVTASQVRGGFGQGRVLLGGQAKAEGMVDGTATLGEVIGMAARRAGSRTTSASAAHRKRMIAIADACL